MVFKKLKIQISKFLYQKTASFSFAAFPQAGTRPCAEKVPEPRGVASDEHSQWPSGFRSHDSAASSNRCEAEVRLASFQIATRFESQIKIIVRGAKFVNRLNGDAVPYKRRGWGGNLPPVGRRPWGETRWLAPPRTINHSSQRQRWRQRGVDHPSRRIVPRAEPTSDRPAACVSGVRRLGGALWVIRRAG